MGKKYFIAILIAVSALILIVGGLAYYKYSQIQTAIAENANFQLPPESVTSAKAESTSWEETVEAVAAFAPFQGVMISAESEGKIVQIFFESGKAATKGEPMVQLDVAVEEAQLKNAVAKAELALTNINRLGKLKGTGALAAREVDDAESQVQQTTADIETIKASIDRKTIRAPFTGVSGLSQVQVGQYLKAGDPVVTLQTLSPIYVNFSVPQQAISAIKVGQTIQATVDAFPTQSFNGTITAMNPLVDSSSRTIQVQATIPNKDELLRSGMYGTVRITVGSPKKVVTVPQTAVNHAPYGDSIYVIKTLKDPKGNEYLGVQQEFVKLGSARGDQVAILKGINEGDEIATSGLFKLRPGASVKINNEITPQDQAKPAPADS